MNTMRNHTKGFTIIEVVLVLAIAGLIFLMVFIALPALQAGQRDTSRKNDLSIIAARMTNYKSSNKGDYPSSTTFQAMFKATDVSDNTDKDQLAVFTPTTTHFSTSGFGLSESEANSGKVWIAKGAKCNGVGATRKIYLTPGSAAQFAVFRSLEGGNNTGYCIDG